jgi:predicted nucleic acid-binding protein
MTLVVDASALAAWLLPDETSADLGTVIAEHADVLAPWLLWAELRNILIVTERRGRLPQGVADRLIEAVEGLGIELDTVPTNAGVLGLARQHALTVYDALYLELALRHGAMLATLDTKLAQSARAEGIILV